ncbi:hypothetical protein BDV12DRAFT_71402 [Aspergillus spectabilis]
MTGRSRGSLACEHCRRRRIKCNQLRPRCSQCARAGLSCSGYRAPIDLLFQDETAIIARKVRKDKEIKSANHKDRSDIFFHPHPSLALVIPSLQVEEFAWRYYLKHFNITRDKPDCFPEPYLTGSSTGMASVTSVGLAALALIHQDPHMMELARKKYSAALRHMARAVLDPQELRKGTTTTASFNLSMFEMIISDGPEAAYSWLRHIHGTAALMRVVYMPSNGAVSPITGCLQVSFTVAVGCLISEQPVPPDVIRLVKSLTRADIYADVSPIIELFILLSSLVNLYVQAKKSQSGDRGSTDITSALDEIDGDLIDWESRLPPLWTGAPHTGSILHDQGSKWIPRLWGYYRLCRILTHRVLLDNNHQSPGREEVSRQILQDMCSEIYASVPSMLQRSVVDACFEPFMGLTSDVFFLVTILQALLKLTERKDVIENWAAPAAEKLGGRFIPLRGFVARHLC